MGMGIYGVGACRGASRRAEGACRGASRRAEGACRGRVQRARAGVQRARAEGACKRNRKYTPVYL